MALKQLTLLALASTLPLAQSAETVLGVYIFHRHGDRTPKSHPPANLTSLGAEEVYLSGSYYRNRYVASDASSAIRGLSHDVAVQSQIGLTAPDDAVLHNSAQVFAQGLYPPVGRLSTEELANGTSVEAPLGGYQYIPVKAVSTSSSGASSTRADAENNEWLQGGSGCGNAMVSSNNYFASSEYQKTYSDSKGFYQSLLPVISGTFGADQANFKNGYTIFDLINVARIHNKTIPSSDLLTPETVAKVQNLANIHEWNLAFNETEPIRAIAGSVLAGQILQQLQSTLDGKSKSPLGIQFGAYASFSSFFGLAQLPKVSADFTGIVDYASSMAFELVTNSTKSPAAKDDVSVRFLFSNGTAGAAGNVPIAYPLFGRAEALTPWSVFVDEMNKFAIGDTKSWCTACGNSTGQCAPYASGSNSNGGDATTAASKDGNGISTAVAGVIGALVTLVVILGIEGLVYALMGLRLVKKSTLASRVEVSGASKA
ncbi:histidine acid phosphatase protein [Apiospora arundinis]|uniref:Histidine acid phosphatase protein n=1 Tax=Apiospora arundinis TaxID=335852 RepID=A0ABR2J6B8_9PEZI